MTHFSREPYEASPEEEAEREADIDSHDHEWATSEEIEDRDWDAWLAHAHRRAVEAEIDREMAAEREAEAFETMLRVLSRPNRCPW